MGLVCALVYLLAVINFLPFAFKRDMIEATTEAGIANDHLEAQHIEVGRFLHRFPLEKVRRVARHFASYQTIWND